MIGETNSGTLSGETTVVVSCHCTISCNHITVYSIRSFSACKLPRYGVLREEGDFGSVSSPKRLLMRGRSLARILKGLLLMV
jgi:hypothetical protein